MVLPSDRRLQPSFRQKVAFVRNAGESFSATCLSFSVRASLTHSMLFWSEIARTERDHTLPSLPLNCRFTICLALLVHGGSIKREKIATEDDYVAALYFGSWCRAPQSARTGIL
jgi:hypothetical protein